jgi:hypothetical protein
MIPLSNFQSTFSHALHAYKKRTRGDLILHPLAARLQSCNSPGAILDVLREQAQAIDQSWNEWLDPIVNVLYVLSSTLGEGVGLVIIGTSSLSMYVLPSIIQVSSPAKVIFVGIDVILSVCTFLDSHVRGILTPKIFQEAHVARANRDELIDIFGRMAKFFRRLLTYTVVPPPQSTKNSSEEIMLTVLSIITTLTEEVKEGRASKLIAHRYLIIYLPLIRKVFEEANREKFR